MDESFLSLQFYVFAVKQYFIMHKLFLVWGKMVDCIHPTAKGFELSKRRLVDFDGQEMPA